MAALLAEDGYSLNSLPRPENENPRDPRCLLHLQRICGTCAAYQGALRPPRIGHDPDAYNRADCERLGIEVHRLGRAWDCPRWERKTQGGQS